MGEARRLLAVLAHPDDESLGCGGTLARYAADGVEVHVLTATRGEAGRHGPGPRPEAAEVGRRREAELRRAADVLGVGDVTVLGWPDGAVDRVDARRAVDEVAEHLRRVRPQVVVTFAHDGAYGHPDHVAVCQVATAACVAAAGGTRDGRFAHRVDKLYWLAWPDATWDRYQKAFRTLTSTVDGEERRATPWPGWALTARVDARPWWRLVWEAVRCHESQMALYGRLDALTEADHEVLWGDQTFYRAYSTVNGGRTMEDDLFEGLP